MSSVPNTNPAPNNRDIFQNFRAEYGAALADARLSAEHTGTEGWQRLFSDRRDKEREHRRELAKQLRTQAERLEDFGLTEDDEKAIKDIAKASAELRDSGAVFERETIGRVCAPVQACERIALQYINQATRLESDTPLHNIGVEEMMRIEIGKYPKPLWDAENGIVEIKESAA